MTVHPTNLSEVAWTSWLPAMGYALGGSNGPVLEIGVGHFSTPFLHEFCRAAGRELWSVESDPEWRRHFAERYEHAFHRFGYPSEIAIPEAYFNKTHWGVVLIDNSPGGEARARPFQLYLPSADYVVVHDYHRENEAAIAPLIGTANHRVFRDYEPPTLLASMTRAVGPRGECV